MKSSFACALVLLATSLVACSEEPARPGTEPSPSAEEATTTSEPATAAPTDTAIPATDTPVASTNTPLPPRPAPTLIPARPVQPAAGSCHPSYQGACLDPNASDYDCAGGQGNGPNYTGRVTVVGPDVFDLDRDNDGVGCE